MNAATKTISAKERRAHNLGLALALADMGIYVFPSKNKMPICAAWHRGDDQLNADQATAESSKFEQRNGFKPPHVGSTTNKTVIKRLWRDFPDAVPSISAGPSNLYIVDADVAVASEGKRAKDGPNKLAAYLADHGIDIAGALTVETQSGGKHLYFMNTEGLDSKAGLLRDLDSDVRGIGGQVVAPGAIREDGKTYRIVDGDLSALASLPPVPQGIVAAVRTARESKATDDREIAALMVTLLESDPEPFANVFNEAGYDLERLARNDPEFTDLYANGACGDFSDARFKMAICLRREWPTFTIADFMTFLESWDHAGEFVGDAFAGQSQYNLRNVCRDFSRSQGGHKVADKKRMSDILALANDCEDAISTRESFEVNKLISETLKVADKTPKVPTRRGQLVAESLDQLCQGDEVVSWLVKNYLEVGITGVFFGPPGEGKTAALIDLGLRVSHGIPWHGRKTKRTGVLYVIQEGRAGAKRRVRAWLKLMKENGHEVGGGAFRMVRASIDLFNSDRDMYKLIKLAKEFPFDFGVECGIIIVDTLAQALKGGNASSDQDIGIVTGRMDYMRDETGAFVAAVHHTGKEESRGPRGSNAIPGNTDVCIAIIDKTFQTSAKGTKLREGDPTQKFPFSLNVVVMGQDEDGDPVTTIVASESRRGLDDVSAEDEGKLDYAPLDGLKERQEMVVEVFDRFADQQKPSGAPIEETMRGLALTMSEIEGGLNAKRKKWKMTALKNSSVYDVIKPMVEGGAILKVGTRHRPRYTLVVEPD